MGSKFVEVKLATSYTEDDVRQAIKRILKINNFDYQYDIKSLDLRQKNNIYWQTRFLVFSPEIKGNVSNYEKFELPIYSKRIKTVAVIGSGPAGFFAAEVLNKAGFEVSIFERGSHVDVRSQEISEFEKTNLFSEQGNYVYGEGGAGTFSDGKLTSRTKGVSAIKNYILSNYVEAGAPKEILYLSKPHIGSDNLIKVVKNLRLNFEKNGGKIHFRTLIKEIKQKNKKWILTSDSFVEEFDIVIIAAGHSSYDTFRMLLSAGITIYPKPFAMGFRVEHSQELINKAVWGKSKLPGIKAAEYVLKWNGENNEAVYSFCMCPGGKVVQSSPSSGLSIVNGMSNYQRDSAYANSAMVMPFNSEQKFKKSVSAEFMLDYIQNLEAKIWNLKNGFAIPACNISDFLKKSVSNTISDNSYSHGVVPYDYEQFFDKKELTQFRTAFENFSNKLKGFDQGVILGFESKTSSALRIERDNINLNCIGFDNLYAIGEGSGYSGGIISSAVDGVRIAQKVSQTHK